MAGPIAEGPSLTQCRHLLDLLRQRSYLQDLVERQRDDADFLPYFINGVDKVGIVLDLEAEKERMALTGLIQNG